LLKRGLDRGYELREDELRSIRGKLLFGESIKKNLLAFSRAHCEFDELSFNVLHNRIIKSTIKMLVNVDELDPGLRDNLSRIYKHLSDISEIRLHKRIFRLVQLYSNNSFYDFILKICRLIFDNVLLSEESGKSRFRDFMRDEKQMAGLFEEFVRNFYKLEQHAFYVAREYIEWDAIPVDEYSRRLLPRMQTDISLESRDRKIVIDAKYYKDALSDYYETEKVRQDNLLQIFGYLKHLEQKGGINARSEGILIYPTVNREIPFEIQSQGHKISVKTINLNQKWDQIHHDLLAIIN
jgi:5-methylcytosine-specific restriction enzyme subunit McrC